MTPARRRDPVLLLIRGGLIGLGGLVGLMLSERLFDDPLNAAYLTALGALVASLVTGRAALALRRQVSRAAAALQLGPRAVLAATVAAILALLLSVLLNNILQAVPGFAWYHSVLITFVLSSLLILVAVANQEVFVPVGGRPTERRGPGPAPAGGKLLDSSVIIDGRVLEVARLGFLEGPLVVPGSVLRELQHLADGRDSAKRAAGRRGLEVLEQLRAAPEVGLLVREFPEATGPVDEQLVRAALETGAALVTNDAALQKIAGLQGARVLSLNALAESLKPRHAAGDELTITVVREGSQPGQGIGYLEDGTMVVVEEGLALRGRTVRVAVVSNIQTALGRMIFAKPKELV